MDPSSPRLQMASVTAFRGFWSDHCFRCAAFHSLLWPPPLVPSNARWYALLPTVKEGREMVCDSMQWHATVCDGMR